MLKFDLTISTLHLTVSPGQNCSLSLSAHHPLSWLWILIISLARGRSLSKEKSYKFLMSLPIFSPPGSLDTKFALASMPKVPGATRSAQWVEMS